MKAFVKVTSKTSKISLHKSKNKASNTHLNFATGQNDQSGSIRVEVFKIIHRLFSARTLLIFHGKLLKFCTVCISLVTIFPLLTVKYDFRVNEFQSFCIT